MEPDDSLKHLMQLCADVQDGLWLAAAYARRVELPPLFQDAAVQWNAFADQVFSILLRVDHTSPDAKWKADPNREWLAEQEEIEKMDDRRLCRECLDGLNLAQTELRKISAQVGHPQVRALVDDQLRTSADQMASFQPYASSGLRSAIARHRPDSSGGNSSIN
jgi:hypothetical protein